MELGYGPNKNTRAKSSKRLSHTSPTSTTKLSDMLSQDVQNQAVSPRLFVAFQRLKDHWGRWDPGFLCLLSCIQPFTVHTARHRCSLQCQKQDISAINDSCQRHKSQLLVRTFTEQHYFFVKRASCPSSIPFFFSLFFLLFVS